MSNLKYEPEQFFVNGFFMGHQNANFRALSQHGTSSKIIQGCQIKSTLFSKNPCNNNNIGNPALRRRPKTA